MIFDKIEDEFIWTLALLIKIIVYTIALVWTAGTYIKDIVRRLR